MIKNWIQAARPKTLFVSISPVIITFALTIGSGTNLQILPAAICILFAVMAQIISNFVNDYADFLKGSDDENRLGPKRMLASGLISKKSMEFALAVSTLVTGALGLSLIYWGGWILLPVGIVIFVGAYSYSAGPWPLAYHGLGDVAVVLFYGFVPVVFTYYVLCSEISLDACIAGVAMGLVADNLLIVNNYRDAEQDRLHNKKTTLVLFGKSFGRIMFILNPLLAIALGFFFIKNTLAWIAFGVCFLVWASILWKRLKKTEGAALNKLLAKSSLLSLAYAAIVLIATII